MRIYITIALVVILLLPVASSAQAPPTTVPERKPSLRRDRTLKVVYPKIIQYEDERIAHNELIDMLVSSHGGARRRAILALGRIGYPTGVAPLIDVLNNDRIPEMRGLAAFSLGESESHYAASDLPEAAVLASWGGQAVVVPYLQGRSTTRLIQEASRGSTR